VRNAHVVQLTYKLVNAASADPLSFVLTFYRQTNRISAKLAAQENVDFPWPPLSMQGARQLHPTLNSEICAPMQERYQIFDEIAF
jgi:hypothetical protein